MNKIVQKEGFQEKHFVDAIIETKVFIDSDFETQTVTHEAGIPLHNITALKFIGNATSPNRSKILSGFLNLLRRRWGLIAMQCTPLPQLWLRKKMVCISRLERDKDCEITLRLSQ